MLREARVALERWVATRLGPMGLAYPGITSTDLAPIQKRLSEDFLSRCFVLARRGQGRWMAWWVAVVVLLHFLPLAVFLRDPSLAGLGSSKPSVSLSWSAA